MSNSLLKITQDGSHTLYVTEIDECYHSTHGAVQESEHIFIKDGFRTCMKDTIHVLEIGFGTGLNAFLTLLETERQNKRVYYTAIELYPVEGEKAFQLNYPEQTQPEKRTAFERIHTSAWNEWQEITSFFQLKKINDDFTRINLTEKYDVIYFDAFSPEKQPEMWTEDLFKKLYLCTREKAVLTTYCCKGTVKRALKAAGFSIEKLPGPAGKREILRALRKPLNPL